MNRFVRAAGMGAAAASLVVAPWVGSGRVVDDAPAVAHEARPVVARAGPWLNQPTARRAAAVRGGCGCDDVVINARNVLRDAEIRTGDAKVRNVNVTYISAAYVSMIEGEIEIEVEQQADAISGDALAGQLISALATGPRCANILIRAINILEDVEVRTGDAIAINRNVVLLDPGVDRGRLDIDVDQEANAKSGEAIAGQVIGAAGAGRGGCGGVKVEARNLIKDVEVRTGEARSRNENSIRTCGELGCAAELLELVGKVGSVRMCTASGCRSVSARELRALLTPVPAEPAVPSESPIAPVEPEPEASPSGSPPEETPAGEPSPSPSPSPTPPPEGDPAGGSATPEEPTPEPTAVPA